MPSLKRSEDRLELEQELKINEPIQYGLTEFVCKSYGYKLLLYI